MTVRFEVECDRCFSSVPRNRGATDRWSKVDIDRTPPGTGGKFIHGTGEVFVETVDLCPICTSWLREELHRTPPQKEPSS